MPTAQIVARRSLLSRTQLHHEPKIFTCDNSAFFLFCEPRQESPLSGPGEGSWSQEVMDGAGHGNVYVS